MATRRSSRFDANVDQDLLSLLESVGKGYSPYDVELFSGNAARPTNPGSMHPRGGAVDVNLIDRKTGAALPNIRDPASAQAYQAFANELYKAADPEMQKRLRWGGYFEQGVPKDWMHFDVGGADRMQAGSWQGGFNPEVMKELRLASAGGLGPQAQAVNAQMQAAGYTPEQRRNAIASIESAGSGDYNAVGPEADPAGHRARGRYQVMDYNIEPWAEQYLKQPGVTPDQFMKDPALQDKLFDAVMGDYASKYGERGAASKWFTGSEKEPARSDVNGKLTGKTYADRYMEALGATPTAQHPPNPQTGTGGYVAPGAPTTGVPAAQPAWKKMLADIGKSGAAIGDFQPGPSMIQPQPAAARIDQGEYPTIDPQQQEMQRQQLAMAMQRLNSGRLF